MATKKKAAAPRRKTGQPRLVNQPLSIDALPVEVHEAIKYLRATKDVSWPEIERLSALPYSAEWKDSKEFGKHGFVNWDALPTHVLEKFPKLHLPHSNVHRWWDVRVQQAAREVLERSAQARELAQAFAAASIEGADEAVLNAARDVIFGMLQQQDAKSRSNTASKLLALGIVMQEARANTIKERKVAVDEKKLKALEAREELNRRKLERETDDAAKKLRNGGEVTLDDLNRLRERVFGLPAVGKQ
jgi:hypothetical protein